MAFKIFGPDKKVENLYSTVAEPMLSGDSGTLSTFFTGSSSSAACSYKAARKPEILGRFHLIIIS